MDGMIDGCWFVKLWGDGWKNGNACSVMCVVCGDYILYSRKGDIVFGLAYYITTTSLVATELILQYSLEGMK